MSLPASRPSLSNPSKPRQAFRSRNAQPSAPSQPAPPTCTCVLSRSHQAAPSTIGSLFAWEGCLLVSAGARCRDAGSTAHRFTARLAVSLQMRTSRLSLACIIEPVMIVCKAYRLLPIMHHFAARSASFLLRAARFALAGSWMGARCAALRPAFRRMHVSASPRLDMRPPAR